ncbi:hypothetical protein PANDA_016287 [Ailuropoda melanoleuca]|uniref:Leukocyte surface antigen CD47 n=1 Tax=Ailuropoda melanoleuca TaxID=9646 RepID=D2HVA6_AILME|nr:hypothetical protein PANDA_016287 [Ailuropoda melanoleuca]
MITSKLPKPDTTPACSNRVAEFIPKMYGSAYFVLLRLSSAQLIFNITKSVEYTACNESVIIPCFVNNVEATNINEMYVKWKLKGKDIFTFNGALQKTTHGDNFKSTKIIPQKLLTGIASLEMDKAEAVVGNYTCEVTELSREGETIIELKYRIAIKYKANLVKEKTILLLVGGLLLTIVVIVGAILFVPGVWMSPFTIAILILQVLGYVLSVVGLSLCVSECTPVHGPLLISGLGITALAELLGLVYMKLVVYSEAVPRVTWEAEKEYIEKKLIVAKNSLLRIIH